jgi:bifunctional pyridoxal-dependent enzyme with beta-cystathionase and maltose regulon repressor activities
MDFPLAAPIHRALSEQLVTHDYGYTLQLAEEDSLFKGVIQVLSCVSK